MKIKMIFKIIVLMLLIENFAYASNITRIYKKAENAAKKGNIDFAFMNYRSILSSNSNSNYRQRALFAIGEYFYLMADKRNTQKYFNNYLEITTNLNGKLFACVYLLNIAKHCNDDVLTNKLENEIRIIKQNSFIFKEKKEYKYNSPLKRKHKAVYYIDKIEFFVEGEKLAKIFF